MPDIVTLSAFLGSITSATEIAKALRTLDVSISQADLKFKIAELLESLTDAKIAGVELREVLQEKDAEISRLNEALSLKEEVVKSGDAYFKKGLEKRNDGDAFCLRCWEGDHKLFHLVRATPGPRMLCPMCKTAFEWQSIRW